jgi:hypothetical protein
MSGMTPGEDPSTDFFVGLTNQEKAKSDDVIWDSFGKNRNYYVMVLGAISTVLDSQERIQFAEKLNSAFNHDVSTKIGAGGLNPEIARETVNVILGGFSKEELEKFN